MSASDETGQRTGKGASVIRVPLLLFVVGSVVYMAVRGEHVEAPSHLTPSASVVPQGVTPDVVVYFFDADIRCSSCERIERYSYETLATKFPEELAAGRIAWRVLNTDRAENEHYLTDYHLYSKSIVLVETKDAEQVRYENLEKIWNLVYDEEAFVAYIEERVRAFLEGVS